MSCSTPITESSQMVITSASVDDDSEVNDEYGRMVTNLPTVSNPPFPELGSHTRVRKPALPTLGVPLIHLPGPEYE